MKKVTIYVVCSVDNYYKEGKAIAELVYNGIKKEVEVKDSGYDKESALILRVLISAFEKLKYPCEVTVKSNNEYLVKGIKYWVASWERNGWKTKAGRPVANDFLWQKLLELLKQHTVMTILVKDVPDDLQEKVYRYMIEESGRAYNRHMYYRSKAGR